MDDRALKKDFKKKASQNYQKYYAVDTLNSLGFTRKLCKKCGTYFSDDNPQEAFPQLEFDFHDWIIKRL